MRVSLALLAVSLRSVVAQDSCPAMQPICTSASYTFAAAVGTTSPAGPNYGCLESQPSPAWYYLEIDRPGQIDILMSMADAMGTGKDIDFAMWGPFDSLLASQSACGAGLGAPISCSYSTSATETAVVPSTATTGQFYVLLLTNFANVPAQIALAKAGGPGTTDCSAADAAANDAVVNFVITTADGRRLAEAELAGRKLSELESFEAHLAEAISNAITCCVPTSSVKVRRRTKRRNVGGRLLSEESLAINDFDYLCEVPPTGDVTAATIVADVEAPEFLAELVEEFADIVVIEAVVDVTIESSPTAFPSSSPTAFPSSSPTAFPSSSPTAFPSSSPTAWIAPSPPPFPPPFPPHKVLELDRQRVDKGRIINPTG